MKVSQLQPVIPQTQPVHLPILSPIIGTDDSLNNRRHITNERSWRKGGEGKVRGLLASVRKYRRRPTPLISQPPDRPTAAAAAPAPDLRSFGFFYSFLVSGGSPRCGGSDPRRAPGILGQEGGRLQGRFCELVRI